MTPESRQQIRERLKAAQALRGPYEGDGLIESLLAALDEAERKLEESDQFRRNAAAAVIIAQEWIAEKDKKLARLQQERDGLEKERDEQLERALRLDKWAWELHAHRRAEIARLTAREAALVEALRRFGTHASGCAAWPIARDMARCDCGLGAALLRSRGEGGE